jgi:hypothetical protein
MYEQRLEEILIRLAKTHAPVVIENWPAQRTEADALGKLARRLADFNILVITGEMTPSLQHITQDPTLLLQDWVNTYGDLYSTFVTAIFPHQTPVISGHYTDSLWPVIIYLRGAITPVVQAIAEYITPFIAIRQTSPLLSNAELIGVIDLILRNLEGQDISLEARNLLYDRGPKLLDSLLNGDIHQYPLIPPAQDLFSNSRPMRPVTQQPQRPPQPPDRPRPSTPDSLSNSSRLPAAPQRPPDPPRPSSLPGIESITRGTGPLPEPEEETQGTQPLSVSAWQTEGPVNRPNGDTEQLSATNPIPPGIEELVTPSPDEEEPPPAEDPNLPKPLGPDMPLFYRRRKEGNNDSPKRRRSWLPRHQYGEDEENENEE